MRWLNLFHLIMQRREIVDLAARAVRTLAPDAKIILYGSEARGEARADSDIDLIVLLNEKHLTVDREFEIMSVVCDVELQTAVQISTRVTTIDEWEHPTICTPFYINVCNEGIFV